MKKTVLQKLSSFGLAMLVGTFMMAQSSISGTVTDASGDALIGANVIVQGTTDGTITDFDGTYTLSTSESFPLTLVFSFTGFNATEMVVNSPSSNVNAVMQEGVLLGDDVVISASRRREKVQEAPASISIISARKLEASPNNNPVRNLINEPGITIQQQGAAVTNVQLRGDGGIFGSATFPILDYRSLSGPGLGTYDALNTPVSNIDLDRIEVVRGPGSALYGPGVTAGVIHFLSKSAIDKPGTTIELTGGELSTFGGAIRHATKVSDKFGFKINAAIKKGNEFTLDPNDPIDAANIALFRSNVVNPAISGGVVDPTQSGTEIKSAADLDPDGDGNPLQEDWNSALLNATLEFRPQDDLSIIMTGGMNKASHLFYNSQGFGLSQATETYAQARVQKGGLFGQVFWLNTPGGTDENPTFLYQTGNTTTVGRKQLEAQLQYNFDTPNFLNATWTAGFDYRLSQANTGNTVYGREEDDDDFRISGAYLQTKLGLGDKLDLVLAGRADRFSFLDETSFSPRAVLVWKPSPKHTFRGGFNRAVGAPSQLQVNIDFPVSAFNVPGLGFVGDVWLVGNKNEQTFSSNPEIVFNSGLQALGFPNLPVGTPGIPNAVTYGAATAGLLPLLVPGMIDQFVALGVPAETATSIAQNIGGYLGNPANFPGGFTGEFEGYNIFNGRPLGLLNAPSASLRTEDTWEVGYKGLINDKLGISLDVYNRKIDGATLFTGISPTYRVNNLNIAEDLVASIDRAGLTAFITEQFAFLGPGAGPTAALVANGIIDQGYGGAAGAAAGTEAALAGTIAGLGAAGVLAWTPTEQVPDNGVPHLAAGYRTFDAFDYWGSDLGLNYFVTQDLTFSGSYSWTSDNIFNPVIQGTDGETERTSQSQPNNRYRLGFNYLPEFGFRANASFQHDPSYEVFLGAQFSGFTDVKNLVDASVGYKFDNGLALNLSAQNLFDSKYRTYPGFPTIGRRVLGKMTYTFGDDGASSRSSSGSMAKSKSSGKMDSDGDGIKDSKDACPDIAGTRKFKGCPMSEADMAAKAAAEAKAAEAARMAAEKEAAMKAEAARKAAAERAAAEAARRAAAEKAAAEKAAAEAAAAEAAAQAARAEASRVEAIRVRNMEVSTRFAAALEGLQFNTSRSTFKKDALAKMDAAVAVLNQYGDISVLIQGHTDSQGDADKNRALSQRRADAVKTYLVSKGISEHRMSTSGVGEDYPVADNNTAAGRAQNRRVEFIILR